MWEKISRFARLKKIYILTLVLSEKKILNEIKNHNLRQGDGFVLVLRFPPPIN